MKAEMYSAMAFSFANMAVGVASEMAREMLGLLGSACQYGPSVVMEGIKSDSLCRLIIYKYMDIYIYGLLCDIYICKYGCFAKFNDYRYVYLWACLKMRKTSFPQVMAFSRKKRYRWCLWMVYVWFICICH